MILAGSGKVNDSMFFYVFFGKQGELHTLVQQWGSMSIERIFE